MLLDPGQRFVQQQGKADLPTPDMPVSEKVQLVKTSYRYFLTPLQCYVQQQGKSHLPSLKMPLFERVQLVKPHPCFLTPLQSFVYQQKKAHLATVKMPFVEKGHRVQYADPCLLTPQSPKCESPFSLWQVTANDYIAAGATGCEAQAIAIT